MLFRSEVYCYYLDTVIGQLKSRFTDNVLTVFCQMSHFSHSSLITEDATTTEEVAELCATYDLDAVSVVREKNEFCGAYRSSHHMINVDDLLVQQRNSRPQTTHSENIHKAKSDSELNSDDDLIEHEDYEHASEAESDSEFDHSNLRFQGESNYKPIGSLWNVVNFSVLTL